MEEHTLNISNTLLFAYIEKKIKIKEKMKYNKAIVQFEV